METEALEGEVTQLAELKSYPFPTLVESMGGVKVHDQHGKELTVTECDGLPWQEYLTKFLLPRNKPGTGTYCVSCGHLFTSTDMMKAFLLGASFTWGLRHGSGECSNCKYPARAFHFVKFEDGTEDRLVFVVQYHPDALNTDA